MGSLKEKLSFEWNARLVAITGVMIAVVFVMTYATKIPVGFGGYIHLGDTMVYAAAFLFGPLVGVIAAAFGTSLSDLAAGYGNYAPGTFVIHGLQGLVAGLIAWRGGLNRMIAAGIAGGAIVVVGYFIYESAILQIGVGAAWTNAGLNVVQVASGAIIGIPLVLAIRKAYPPINNWAYNRTWTEEPSKPTRA
jgi:energy-coupling factor transport system substrate-specific component